MHIERITLKNFRNFETAELNPDSRFNVIHGLNGQGKTNLVEAIYWLGTLRALRTSRLRELISWGQKSTSVAANIVHEGLTHQLKVQFSDGSRQAYREEKKVNSHSYFGTLSVVLFTPEDAGLVRGTPEARRRFLDRAIFTGRPAHLQDFVEYKKALDSRNKLLRDEADDKLIELYEEPLARSGAKIIESRAQYVEKLAPRFRETFSMIAGADLDGMLRYRPSIDIKDGDLVTHLSETWYADRAKDRVRGFTQRGPHTDDLAFSLLGRSARNYASQGQQRAMVLASKISEIGLLKTEHNRLPVLLLDDVSSELDAERNRRLFEFLDGFEGQVFITTTDPGFLHINAQKTAWKVSSGEIDITES